MWPSENNNSGLKPRVTIYISSLLNDEILANVINGLSSNNIVITYDYLFDKYLEFSKASLIDYGIDIKKSVQIPIINQSSENDTFRGFIYDYKNKTVLEVSAIKNKEIFTVLYSAPAVDFEKFHPEVKK